MRIGLLLVATFAITQAATSAFAQFTGKGRISGIVIDSTNGEPVRKAIVTLTLQGATPRAYATERTDAAGNYRFESLPPGKYDLRAAKGSDSAAFGVEKTLDAPQTLSLTDREARADVRLLLIHASEIAGRVTDPDGFPVPSADVYLSRVTRDLGERVLARYREGETDDRGDTTLEISIPANTTCRSDPPCSAWRERRHRKLAAG